MTTIPPSSTETTKVSPRKVFFQPYGWIALGVIFVCLVIGAMGYFSNSSDFRFPALPWWAIPIFWTFILVAIVVSRSYLKWRKTSKHAPVIKNEEPTETTGTEQSSRFKISKTALVKIGLACIAFAFLASIGYVFSAGLFRLSDMPWWVIPTFWSLLIAAILAPAVYRSFLNRNQTEKSITKISKRFFVTTGVILAGVLFVVVCVHVYFTSSVHIPDLPWWGGITFWGVAVVAITAPRIYLSLPKRESPTEERASQFFLRNVEGTTWFLLIGLLFLVNAVLIQSPKAQDAFFNDTLRFFDTRSFSVWHWWFFIFGVGGFFANYYIRTRILLANQLEQSTSSLVAASHLTLVCGSTFSALFIFNKFTVFAPIIDSPFTTGFSVRYWSVIWIALGVEILFLVNPKLFQQIQKRFQFDHVRPDFSSSFPHPALWIAPVILGCVGVAIAYLLVSGTVQFSDLPWWTMPMFWALVIIAVLSPKIYQALPKRSTITRIKTSQGLSKTGFNLKFNASFFVAVIGVAAVFAMIGGFGYVFSSGMIRFSDRPWWAIPAFWLSIIVAGVSYKVIDSVRKFLKESGTKRNISVKAAKIPVAAPIRFNTAAKQTAAAKRFSIPGISALNEFGSMLWIIVAGIIGVPILCYLGYSQLMMERLDADGHPLPMSWWVIPSLCGLTVLAAIVYKIVLTIREDSPTISRPITKPVPPKPSAFNAPAKKNLTQNRSGFSWRLPSLPIFENLGELAPFLWLGLIGLIGLLIVFGIGYYLATMEWLDEDGHPVSMPMWVLPVLCILAALGAVAYKIVTTLREDSGSSFRSSTVRSVKAGKPAGFNAGGIKSGGFGKKKTAFNHSGSSDSPFANPMILFGICGGVIVLLLIVIILILIF